jgi:hypothetical protein
MSNRTTKMQNAFVNGDKHEAINLAKDILADSDASNKEIAMANYMICTASRSLENYEESIRYGEKLDGVLHNLSASLHPNYYLAMAISYYHHFQSSRNQDDLQEAKDFAELSFANKNASTAEPTSTIRELIRREEDGESNGKGLQADGPGFEKIAVAFGILIVIVSFFLPFYETLRFGSARISSGMDVISFILSLIDNKNAFGNFELGFINILLLIQPILLTYAGIKAISHLFGSKKSLEGFSDWAYILPFIIWGVLWYNSGSFLAIFSLLKYGFYTSLLGGIIARVFDPA